MVFETAGVVVAMIEYRMPGHVLIFAIWDGAEDQVSGLI